MDFVWVQRGSCVFAKAISVVGVTIRQFPHTVVTRRFRQDLPEIINQLLIRWINSPAYRRFDATSEICALRFAQLRDFRCASFERTSQNVLRSGRADEIRHFPEHFFNDKTRWQDLFLFADLQILEQLIELFRQGIESLQVIFAIFAAEQAMRVCHKSRELVLYAIELIDWIIVPLPLCA